MKNEDSLKKNIFVFLPQGSIGKCVDLNWKTKIFCWKVVLCQKCFRNILTHIALSIAPPTQTHNNQHLIYNSKLGLRYIFLNWVQLC